MIEAVVKTYPYTKKICDMFRLFFGLIAGSTNAIGRIVISTA
jgi:hypothetical protein